MKGLPRRCGGVTNQVVAVVALATLQVGPHLAGADVSEELQLELLREENDKLKKKLHSLEDGMEASKAEILRFTEFKHEVSKVDPKLVRKSDDIIKQRYLLKDLQMGPGDVLLVKNDKIAEALKLAVILGTCLLFFMLPMLWPMKRLCEKCYHKVYPLILLVNLVVLTLGLNELYFYNVNVLFFAFIELVDILIDKAVLLLTAGAGLGILAVMWKFKDRILEAMGIENAAYYIGEPRDWCTCWSMKRFVPLELCIWKETMQINFDPYDAETMLNIAVKNQDVFGATELASVHLGTTQVNRFEEPQVSNRALGWGSANDTSEAGIWAASRFHSIDLIPAGRMYLRFVPVADEPDHWLIACCCPRRRTSPSGKRDTALISPASA